MQVKLGNKGINFPGTDLEELQPCNEYLHDVEALREDIEDKGYLFVRNFHNREEVMKARKEILRHIQTQDPLALDTTNFSLDEGVLCSRCQSNCLPFMEGKNNITHNEAVSKVLEGQHAYHFFEKLFGEKARTFDYKWLRGMPSGGFTGAHIDRVYMSRGSQELLTLWTPFGDLSPDMGVLAVCEGSHSFQNGFKAFQETYGMCDLEAENISGTGWFTENPDEITKLGGKWKTSHFKAGDVIIFNIRLVHMSTTNLTHFARLSCDTRWQPRSHIVDNRFVGDFKSSAPTYGIYGKKEEWKKKDHITNTMHELKERWGFV